MCALVTGVQTCALPIFNDHISRIKEIIRISRPLVEALSEQATAGALSRNFTLEQLRHWRLTSTNLLARTALVYNVWMRSLVLEAADFISDLVSRKCGYPHASQSALWVRRVIESWCADEGMFPERSEEHTSELQSLMRI